MRGEVAICTECGEGRIRRLDSGTAKCEQCQWIPSEGRYALWSKPDSLIGGNNSVVDKALDIISLEWL